LDTFGQNASMLIHPTDAEEHSVVRGAHGAISCGRQYFLRHTVFAILGLNVGSAF